MSFRHRFFRLLLRRRWLTLLLTGASVALSLLGASRVQVDFNIEDLFPSGDTARRVYLDYEKLFAKEDTQVSAFLEVDAPLDVAGYGALERIAGAFQEAGLDDLTWIGSVDVIEAETDDSEAGIAVRALVPRRDLTNERLRRALEHHRDDPLYERVVFSPDQRVFAVHGFLPEARDTPAERERLRGALSTPLSDLAREGHRVRLTGPPIMRAQYVELINRDTGLFLSLGILVMGLVLYAVFRNLWHVSMVLMGVLPGYLATLGMMGAAGIHVSILSSFMPVIILVVGVCDALHVLSDYRRNRARHTSSTEAIVETFAELLVPCFYTALTTATGFASLLATGIDLVAEMGICTAFAVLATYVYGMVLLPVLLSFSRRSTFDDRGLEMRWLRAIVDASVAHAQRGGVRWPLVFAGLAVLSGIAGTQLVSNVYMFDDVRESHAIKQDLRWTEEHGFGLLQVVLWLHAEEGQRLYDPETLAWIERVQRKVEREHGDIVMHTLSFVDVLRQVRGALTGDRSGLPSTSEEAAQLLLVADMGGRHGVRDLYREEQGDAQIVLLVRDVGSARTVPMLAALEQELAQRPPPHARVQLTGTVVLAERVFASIVDSFGKSLLLECVSIFVLMVLMFRSLTQGFLALLPNIVPLFGLVGALYFLKFDLKPSTLLVFSIAFGVAVDDTIHLLSRTRAFVAEGHAPASAVVEAIRASGRAVVLTSVVIGLGFAILMLSSFELLASIGLMTLISVAIALSADLFLYPVVLRAVGRWGTKKGWIEEHEGDPSVVGP